MTGPLLAPAFFARPTDRVARELVGQLLVRDEVVLRITEVEAYGGPEDSGSHCRMGPTPRNAPMWGPPGRGYVYLCYGMHQMLNLVAHPDGGAGAVLIRACEPVAGLALVRERRGGKQGPGLLSGPGKVGAALALDPTWSHHDLCAPGGLEARGGAAPEAGLLVGARVGIGYAAPEDQAAARRFAAAGTPWVSQRRGLAPPEGAVGACHRVD